MTIRAIRLEKITADDSLQVRAYIDSTTVDSYRALMKSNGPLGSLDVFRTAGGKYLLANGWHRLEAAKELGWPNIECTVHKGERRDAVLFAAGANATHGRPLSRLEKTRAVETLLEDEEWFQWSDRRIAKHCGVSPPTVGRVRERVLNELGRSTSSDSAGGSLKKSYSEKRKRTDKHGKISTIDTTNIGRKPQTQAEKNLADLNGALDTLAGLPFGGRYAVELYGNRITDKADAAIEFATDLGEARA